MNNDLRTVSILFGQITSTIISIIIIWVWGDSETGRKFFEYLWFQPLIVKIIFSFLILLGSTISFFRILKLLPKNGKNDGGD
jgi:uncharacterized integral membrane protein